MKEKGKRGKVGKESLQIVSDEDTKPGRTDKKR